MHNTRSIFHREIRGFFNTPMAYIFLVIFSVFNGYFFTSTFFLYNQSDLRSLFSVVPMVYLIFVPAISMGLIARENNIGTMETIATLPIKTYEFVLGKYFAAVVLILLGLLATIIHFITLVKFGAKIDYGALFTGYIGLALVGSMYASIGIFASSITDNQVVAFIIGVFIVLVFFLMGFFLPLVPTNFAGIVQYISVDYHYSNISRGVIDSRNIVYFLSVIGFFLIMTVQSLESRKWS
jgi:ABC-2 type transport system permease protein|tara:strand:- start:1161 stop:1874 length:714 start_codon:yes stop_codon:yes gene_type:complete